MPKHQVECFGSLGMRQFAIDGPHARCQGEVISTYQFVGGVSPATTPRTSLPVLPKAAYALACDLFDGIAAAAGLACVKESRTGRGEATPRVFALDADTEIETRDHGVMTIAELECFLRKRRPEGAATLRCSGRFHDRTRARTDSHLINWGRHGLGIYDTMTETTWHRRERAPSARFEFLGQLQARNPFHEHSTPKAGLDAFDGAAISRADREFLASLSCHPLMRHPLYSVPPPPRPNYDGCTTIDEKAEAQKACFGPALDWMLVNYAYCKSAFMGKGGVISLVDGEMTSSASMSSFMRPYMIVEEGPRGGLKKTSVAEVWMMHPLRAHIDKIQSRPDKPRPAFEEDGLIVYNRYWPPAHPTSGGEIATFERFLARLIPDAVEREWFWHFLAHKARKPWVPMVAIIMVAEKFGTGRGTLFNILELVFGEDYVVPCDFGELTGKSARARFNDRLAVALFALINEADDEEGHLQTRRRMTYESLKNDIEPSPTARRSFEKKGHEICAQRSARTTILATQHRDLIKLPRDDRRFEVITCGNKMTPEERAEIRAWMAIPENIGALHRALLETPAVPLEMFDPFGEPPPFAGRLAMIGMGETRLEDAYGATTAALEGFPLFTMTQAQRLIGYFGDYKTGEWTDKARHAVAKNAYRLRERGEPSNRIRYRKRDEIVYARTAEDQKRWHGADKEMIVSALDRTEEQVARVVQGDGGEIDIAARIEAIRRKPEDGE